ncbi:MAG TPA: hypothetical protein VL282_02715 [Tepidisphaeraceae bacterium]|jgi:hypothetical protein|nr:hypothetical protein [Tepidisphaeraceae bacterium]
MTVEAVLEQQLVRGDAGRTSIRPLVIGMGIFAILSTYAAIKSQGFIEADATTHYLFARFALREHHYLVNVWGRPLITGLYMFPAALGGVLGVRFFCLCLALLCAVITYIVAKRQNYRWPALAGIFLLAQPLMFLHSFSELTELPFATLLILAFAAYQSRRFGWMAILISLAPLGRPEGFGFILVGAVALLAHRKWWWLPVLIVPLILWSYCGWLVWRPDPQTHWWQWLIKAWPYSPTSVYGTGHPLAFLVRMPAVTSPLIFPAMVVGLVLMLRASSYRTHEATCNLIIAVLPVGILIGHSILWWKGWMASSGELRYLLIVGPFWALLSARGWEWIWQRFNWRAPFLWAGAAALLPIGANVYYNIVPFHLYAADIVARDAAEWYKTDTKIQHDFPRLMASPPMVYYFLDRSKSDTSRSLDWGRANALNPPDGTLLIWDPIYGQTNSDRAMCVTQFDLESHGWIWIRRFDIDYAEEYKYCDVYVSPKTATGQPSPDVVSAMPRLPSSLLLPGSD